jgi:hypothetical protein
MAVVATMDTGPVPAMNFSALAFGGGTPKKAILTALVVGTILTSINHGDLILAGELPPLWKVLLTFCVPYCVTKWGAITGKRAQLFQMR